MIKPHQIVLGSLSFACFYVIGSAGLGWFPYLGTATNYKNINTVALNLSYSYLAGVIFYLLTSTLPRHLTQKKLHPFIVKKAKLINSKLEATIRQVYDPNEWNVVTLTKEDVVKRFINVNFSALGSYSIMYPNLTIKCSMMHCRTEINDIITQMLEYHNELSDESITLLESIRESSYFASLNLLHINLPVPITNLNDGIATDLWDCYQISKKLVKSLE